MIAVYSLSRSALLRVHIKMFWDNVAKPKLKSIFVKASMINVDIFPYMMHYAKFFQSPEAQYLESVSMKVEPIIFTSNGYRLSANTAMVLKHPKNNDTYSLRQRTVFRL